eukprot:3860922-Rhodomonas_salina.1
MDRGGRDRGEAGRGGEAESCVRGRELCERERAVWSTAPSPSFAPPSGRVFTSTPRSHCPPIALRLCYAMSGPDMGCGATRRKPPTWTLP